MNKLSEMIEELCPEGVEWRKLGEVCEVLRGKRLTKSQLSDSGEYPVLHGGSSPMGYYDEYNRKENTTVVVNTGNAGCVFFYDKKFWSSDACFSLYPNNGLLDRYLYYCVLISEPILKSKIRVGAMPTIDSNAVKDILLPLPPLAVQQAIVGILDTFDALNVQLEDLLEAEKTAREKQYAYYRDKLLTFDSGVEWRKLGEVCYFENGYALNAKEISQDGRYPCIKISEISNGKIQIGKDYIDELPLKIRDSQLLHGNEILVAMSGSTGKCGFNYNLKNAIVNQRIGIIRNNDKVLTGYLKHCLVNQNFSEYCLKNGTGPQNNVTKGVILNFLLPLPPLAEQERIVAILDKFDALTHDLTHGLPAEIETREKQYAYYRDKLLSFEQK